MFQFLMGYEITELANSEFPQTSFLVHRPTGKTRRAVIKEKQVQEELTKFSSRPY
jgi:hypothetical protein